ncbi:DNA-binding transcriptional regulator, AcrR family [Raineyella antarctica]|uniref:DNA-binding transcriptional regulator, AcrR family n=1 Tax=Raineyella antarctica TaxID=1577474 RepID=A0A1G6HFC3_9ACTN|nr:TetR family transcriptional regulator [Raineyella antarctica]SDB93027.1 DNA-binding transcriptional regulator, AcrR family [Raineyella antarctica]
MSPRTDRAPRRRLDEATRRAMILAAAGAAFDEAPYARVSVSAVAAAAEASEALAYRYFGTKADLYAAVLRARLEDLADRRHAAVAALPANTSARDRVAAVLAIELGHAAAHPLTWAAPFLSGNEPPEALVVRREARAIDEQELRTLLRPAEGARYTYALWGWFGFVDGACLHWVQAGCPQDERWPLVEAALGALQGALGDWGALG